MELYIVSIDLDNYEAHDICSSERLTLYVYQGYYMIIYLWLHTSISSTIRVLVGKHTLVTFYTI